MSATAPPISPARFASALKDLPLSTLHLKAAELRNSIAHLDYSNEEMKPFAEGTSATSTTEQGEPDRDCIDAIKENEAVISRMQERIALLKAEVEGRGQSWHEFRSLEELTEDAKVDGEDVGAVNGTSSATSVRPAGGDQGGEHRNSPWTDGTFQTGRIVNGEVRMDGAASTGTNGGAGTGMNGTTNGVASTSTNATGGSISDENLRRALEERMRNLGAEDDDEDGIHL